MTGLLNMAQLVSNSTSKNGEFSTMKHANLTMKSCGTQQVKT
jgi:hypothetical protein